jgi:hypothetical protein
MYKTSHSLPVKDTKTDIAERIRTTAEDLVELVTAQVKLVRLELLADARELGSRVTRIAIYVPIIVIGYAFLVAGGAWALASRIGLLWALLAVGALHLGVGVLGLVRALRSVREVKVLDRSREELERGARRLAPVVRPPDPKP